VGNTISDAVLDANEASADMAPSVLAGFGLEPDRYILLTAHRPANVDDRSALSGLLEGVANIARHSERRVFFPLHPRTAANLARFGLAESLPAEFILCEPVGFRANILLQRHAYFVATDSGGVQEESCILRKKTLILRDNTERPETLDVGGALLAGHDPDRIFAAYETLRDREVKWINPFGSDVAEKIMRVTA
jgi:UDP-N-acetylglucosamine 2-epimerase (non-hydrolysing)